MVTETGGWVVIQVTNVKTPQEVLTALLPKAKEIGMTELSRRTGIAREYLYRVFAKGGNPSLEVLMKIAKALELDILIG